MINPSPDASMKYSSVKKPAILGGISLRTKPFIRWPVFDEREKSALLEVLECGTWDGYSPKVKEFEEAFAILSPDQVRRLTTY